MAVVHYGRLLGPVGFSRTVAIKRLHPQFAKDPEFVSMFLDEARLAARVRHPNVIATLDVVALEGELFLVMEYVLGESLARLLQLVRERGERVPLPVILSVVIGALHGLHAAHEARSERGTPLGIVHRDVSPQNLLVGADGVTRVLDFGIAKAASRVQTTRDGKVKGKVAYMPPEQVRGETLDRRADVYAASVVLWEALTGRRLFAAEDSVAIMHNVLTEVVRPPSARAGGLPPALDALVLKGLSRARDGRFATAREMAVALEKIGAVAHPREVGEWVERIAGAALHGRAQSVARVESPTAMTAATPRSAATGEDGFVALVVSPSVPPAPEIPSPSRFDSDASRVALASRARRRRRLAVAGLAVGALGAIAVARIDARAGSPDRQSLTAPVAGAFAPVVAAAREAAPSPAPVEPAVRPEPSAVPSAAAARSGKVVPTSAPE